MWIRDSLVFVKAHVGIQSRHADVNARLPHDVIGVGLLEAAFVKNVFRQFDHVDVVMVAAPHGCVQMNQTRGFLSGRKMTNAAIAAEAMPAATRKTMAG